MFTTQATYADGGNTVIKSITVRGDTIAVTFTTSSPSVQLSTFTKNMAAIEELLNMPDVGSMSYTDHEVVVMQAIFDQTDVGTMTYTDEDIKAMQKAFDATDVGTMNEDDEVAMILCNWS